MSCDCKNNINKKIEEFLKIEYSFLSLSRKIEEMFKIPIKDTKHSFILKWRAKEFLKKYLGLSFIKRYNRDEYEKRLRSIEELFNF